MRLKSLARIQILSLCLQQIKSKVNLNIWITITQEDLSQSQMMPKASTRATWCNVPNLTILSFLTSTPTTRPITVWNWDRETLEIKILFNKKNLFGISTKKVIFYKTHLLINKNQTMKTVALMNA